MIILLEYAMNIDKIYFHLVGVGRFRSNFNSILVMFKPTLERWAENRNQIERIENKKRKTERK